jgi:hypothetical protein
MGAAGTVADSRATRRRWERRGHRDGAPFEPLAFDASHLDEPANESPPAGLAFVSSRPLSGPPGPLPPRARLQSILSDTAHWLAEWG